MSVRPRAKGIFTMDKKMHHHFMLSTVTGLAPSMSMVRQYLHDGGHEGSEENHVFYIMYGASYIDELTYDVEIQELAEKHPDVVKFVPTISRPTEDRNDGWKGAHRPGQHHRRGIPGKVQSAQRRHQGLRLRPSRV